MIGIILASVLDFGASARRAPEPGSD